MKRERRHVDEAHVLDPRAAILLTHRRLRPNRSRRRVEHDFAAAFSRQKQPALERDGDDGDDAVPAHGAVALVVHEEHAGVGVGPLRFGEQRPVHVGMAPRLEHQRRPQVVAVLAHPFPLLEHRRALDVRKPVDDEPQRLAGRVRVYCAKQSHVV